jgi:glycine/D-amino acid oxidase-like deaminating enzyme
MVENGLNKRVLTSAPATADVVIIGAGPAGTAAAWAIERAMPGTTVVLVEQSGQPGAGSSLASLENYRTCWPALCLMRQMARSVDVFHNADEYLGEGAAQAIHVKERGYLFCGFTATHAEALQEDVRHLHSIGLTHIEYLNADEVRYRFPYVGERVIAAKFDPQAGWLDSNALIHRYLQSANSARILYDAGNVQIINNGDRVEGVVTAHGTIHTPKVIIAAGANARAVARTAGVELPIVMRPRQSFTVPMRHQAIPEDAPMLIGSHPHPHIRPEARTGAILGWEYTWYPKHVRDVPHGHDYLIDPVYPLAPLKDPRFPSLLTTLLARQFGDMPGQGFADPCYSRGVSHNIGYYVSRAPELSYKVDAAGNKVNYESERALIDKVEQVQGLYVSVAHVGHGIMTSPAAGEIIAALVLDMPLPDPIFAEFGYEVPYVAYDEAVL